jgi:hypothetical protein
MNKEPLNFCIQILAQQKGFKISRETNNKRKQQNNISRDKHEQVKLKLIDWPGNLFPERSWQTTPSPGHNRDPVLSGIKGFSWRPPDLANAQTKSSQLVDDLDSNKHAIAVAAEATFAAIHAAAEVWLVVFVIWLFVFL